MGTDIGLAPGRPAPRGRPRGRSLRRSRGLLLLLLPLPALAVLARRVSEPVHGEHAFRQAHVMANVEIFLEEGLSMRPRTYNRDVPGFLFDFPLFPWIVAGVASGGDASPVAIARSLSIACFLLGYAVLAALFREARLPWVQSVAGLAFFTCAPAVLYFFQTPLPDTLALLAAFLSLLGYARFRRRGERPALALMLGGGVVATLIKNPLYLPFFAGILWHAFRRDGVRGLLRPPLLAFVAAVAASVVGFKLYSNHVNATGAFLTSAEGALYFGPPGDRLDLEAWRTIYRALRTRISTPGVVRLAAAGIVLHALFRRRAFDPLLGGLALGSLVTVVVFFNRHREHTYYQLPLVPVLALFAGGALHWASGLLARPLGRRGRRWAAAVGTGLVLLVAAAQAPRALRHVEAMHRHWMEAPARAGPWLQARVARADCLVYVTDEAGDWNPGYLYFARRYGINLSGPELTPERLRGPCEGPDGPRRVVVFFPAGTGDGLASQPGSLPARPLAAGPEGELFEVGLPR